MGAVYRLVCIICCFFAFSTLSWYTLFYLCDEKSVFIYGKIMRTCFEFSFQQLCYFLIILWEKLWECQSQGQCFIAGFSYDWSSYHYVWEYNEKLKTFDTIPYCTFKCTMKVFVSIKNDRKTKSSPFWSAFFSKIPLIIKFTNNLCI